MQAYQKKFIELAIKQNALRFGDFTLKSGRKSPYFFNMGALNSGAVLRALGQCYANAIIESKISFDMLFGPAYKGIPLVCASAIALHTDHQQDWPFSFNRKEAKDHGEGGQVVGAPLKGRVLVIDDVITAGTALRQSFDLIADNQAKIAGVVVALDRQEKGQGSFSAIQELANAFQVPVKSIITFKDILDYVSQESELHAFREAMLAYRHQYGI